MKPRRWTPNTRYLVSGIDLRTVEGSKVPGDIRLEVWSEQYVKWTPVTMDLAFFLVDFFAENEQHIKQHRSFWRENGDRYFLSRCVKAVREGWEAAAEEVRRQRRGAA